MSETHLDVLDADLAQARAQLEVQAARIRELEGDQEILLDDVERLNGCLTRAYEIRRSSQERLAGARAEIISLRGIVRAGVGDPSGGGDE